MYKVGKRYALVGVPAHNAGLRCAIFVVDLYFWGWCPLRKRVVIENLCVIVYVLFRDGIGYRDKGLQGA